MAGHNKWSKVNHNKARVDAIKGQVFSKCAHEIALAARAGGSDPAANSRLRTAIDNAKSVSMPKDNIDRAIKKGSGELGVEAIQEIVCKGYCPAGTPFIIEMATDNLTGVAANELSSTANALGTSGLKIISEKLVSIHQDPCVVNDLKTARQVFNLDDLLDDDADTINVLTNFEVADPILDQLAS